MISVIFVIPVSSVIPVISVFSVLPVVLFVAKWEISCSCVFSVGVVKHLSFFQPRNKKIVNFGISGRLFKRHTNLPKWQSFFSKQKHFLSFQAPFQAPQQHTFPCVLFGKKVNNLQGFGSLFKRHTNLPTWPLKNNRSKVAL